MRITAYLSIHVCYCPIICDLGATPNCRWWHFQLFGIWWLIFLHCNDVAQVSIYMKIIFKGTDDQSITASSNVFDPAAFDITRQDPAAFDSTWQDPASFDITRQEWFWRVYRDKYSLVLAESGNRFPLNIKK